MRALQLLVAILPLAACGDRTLPGAVDGGCADGPCAAADAARSEASTRDVAAADAVVRADAAAGDALLVTDAGAPTASCTAAGGVLCTAIRFEICPAGLEPVGGSDPHAGCGGDGWCCQPAPPSTCAQSGQGNCVTDACSGCWAPVPGLACETGRVCCQDMCN